MKSVNHKIIAVAFSSVLLGSLSIVTPAFAEHELRKKPAPEKPVDSHLTWHQFEHELLGFEPIHAVMSHEGVLTLSGHVEDGMTRAQIVKMAEKVVGVVEVRNLIFTD